MAVTQDDITFMQSANTGSTGGSISGVESVTGVNNNLFADVSPASALAGGAMVRKWFVRNDSASDALPDWGVWIAQPPAGCTEELGVGFDHADDDDADRGDLDAWTAGAVVALESSAADTRTATVVGLNAVGAPVEEQVVLDGTTPVLTTVTFSEVYAVRVSATGVQTVTIKQGFGGTTRGTIPSGALCTWVWLTPTDFSSSVKRKELSSGGIAGFWSRLTWDPATPEVDPTESIIAIERL